MADVSVTFTNVFEDGTEDKLTINHVESTALANLKIQVKAFNSTIAESEFPNKLSSKTGAKWKRIGAVDVVQTNRVYIF